MIELVGDEVTRLLAPDGKRIGARIGVARALGALRVSTADACAWVVVEGGEGILHLGERALRVSGRADVFDGPGWSAIIGRDAEVAIDGGLRTTVVWRALEADLDLTVENRVIDPGQVSDEARGSGTTARRVRTYANAGPLIVGETLNPPGGWSSWPPHSHTHEEIYCYRFEPAHGFGIHADLAVDGAGPRVVRDGDIVRITHGEHPVVAAPGCAMYYLWALAGDTDTVDTQVDPRFAPPG